MNPEYAEMARERLRTWYKRPEPAPEMIDGQERLFEIHPEPPSPSRETVGARSQPPGTIPQSRSRLEGGPPGQSAHSNARW